MVLLWEPQFSNLFVQILVSTPFSYGFASITSHTCFITASDSS
uniref:Uncharacterized protein n=1 Tax=Rhizophora mucronata TaxID=61149 RepID=A0A2P2PT61_RHIMU